MSILFDLKIYQQCLNFHVEQHHFFLSLVIAMLFSLILERSVDVGL